MIVFAVMVALGVEEWRTEQGLEDFADRVRWSVVAELEANLEELQSTAPSLAATQTTLGQVVATGELALLTNDVGFGCLRSNQLPGLPRSPARLAPTWTTTGSSGRASV